MTNFSLTSRRYIPSIEIKKVDRMAKKYSISIKRLVSSIAKFETTGKILLSENVNVEGIEIFVRSHVRDETPLYAR